MQNHVLELFGTKISYINMSSFCCVHHISKTLSLTLATKGMIYKLKRNLWNLVGMALFLYKIPYRKLIFGRVSFLVVPFLVFHKGLFILFLVQTYYHCIVMWIPKDIWEEMLKSEENLIHCLSTKLICLDKVTSMTISNGQSFKCKEENVLHDRGTWRDKWVICFFYKIVKNGKKNKLCKIIEYNIVDPIRAQLFQLHVYHVNRSRKIVLQPSVYGKDNADKVSDTTQDSSSTNDYLDLQSCNKVHCFW